MAKYFLIILTLLILISACGSPVSNSAVPAISEIKTAPEISSEQPEPIFIENEFIKIEVKKDSPVQILTVTPVNGSVKNGINAELKNVSDKTTSSVRVAVTQPLNCAETMMLADIGANQSNNGKKAEIKPSETFVFQVSPSLTKIQMANRKCTKLTPGESTKSMIYIMKVDFSDNSNWSRYSKTE